MSSRAALTIVSLVSVGILLGAYAGFLRTMGNGYLAVGFRRNLFFDVWPMLQAGALLGLVAGAGVVAAVLLARRVLLHRLRPGDDPVARLSGQRWVAVCFFLAAAAVLSVVSYRGGLGGGWPLVHAYLAASAAAATLAHLAARRWQGRGWLEPLLSAGWLLAGISLALGLALYSPAIVQAGLLPRSPDALAAEQRWALVVPTLVTLALAGLVLLAGFFALRTRGGARRGLAAVAALPTLAWAALWVASPIVSRPTLAAANPTNVVFVMIDTLRFDSTSLAAERGSGARATPHLARLAERSVSFDSAITQAPWTVPACASLFTGLYPWEHGATGLAHGVGRPQLTLPEILREAGYDTIGVVSNHLVGARYGFAQGFRVYDKQARNQFSVTGGNVTDAVLDHLAERAESPLFLYVHYFDPHFAYLDHEGWPFADAYQGWVRDGSRSLNLLRAEQYALDETDRAFLRSLYDEEVAYADRELGRLLEGIEALGLDEDTMIVVVSDHGEEFFEHGWLGHRVMNTEVLHVPLLVALPGADAPSHRVIENVESRAVFGTILDFLGLSSERLPTLPSLLPQILDPAKRPDPDAPVLSHYLNWEDGARTELWAVQSGPWRYVRDDTRGRETLYDLGSDPREQRDLSAARPDKLAEMRAHLDALAPEHASASAEAPAVSESEAEQLKALGYAF